jgi:phage terminase large subunit-like protein
MWTNQGLIKGTPGAVIDYKIIRKDINDLKSVYDITEINYDSSDAAIKSS